MRILLTGATGYIGSAVLDVLVEAGHEVTAVVRTERAARDVAGRAHTYLRARAAVVGDDELARQYLEVPVHAALLAAAP